MNTSRAPIQRRWWLFPVTGLLTVAIVISISVGLTRLALWPFFPGDAGQEAIAPSPAQQKAESLLADADTKAKAALDARLKALAGLFSRGRAGAKPFAEDALSWGGKWALLSETIGLSEAKSHEKFLAEKFSKHVFTSAELESALKAVVEGYLLDLEALESEMLLKLLADIADASSPSDLPAAFKSDALFRQEYERFRTEVALTLQSDLKVTAAREVGLFVASDVAGAVLLRVANAVAAELGLQAGILGLGASSSVATFGAGLVAAFLLDYLVDFVLRAGGYNPEGEIADKVRSCLTSVERAAIEGKGGLRQELSRLHSTRSQLRRESVLRLVAERE